MYIDAYCLCTPKEYRGRDIIVSDVVKLQYISGMSLNHFLNAVKSHNLMVQKAVSPTSLKEKTILERASDSGACGLLGSHQPTQASISSPYIKKIIHTIYRRVLKIKLQ